MRIVSWNMNHCMRNAASRRRAWDYLRSGLRADIALVQEAYPASTETAVFQPIHLTKRQYAWGSAVVSFRPDLCLQARPRVPLTAIADKAITGAELPDSHPGASAVADVVDAAGRFQFTVVSLYGQWESIADGRIYSCAKLHRMISDLTGVFAGIPKRQVLLAGDFNVTTQIAYGRQTQADTDGAAAVFTRLRAWGLKDCIEKTKASRPRMTDCTCPERETCSHVRTFRLKNRAASRPTQVDYVFASDRLVDKVRCEVVQTDEAWALSDHCPIVLELGQ